jgi:hypothetical protein
MTARLPIPGGDDGTWGDILNDYLEVSLASDGTVNPGVIGTAQLQNNCVTNAQLDVPTQTIIDSVASKYVKPAGGIPSTDLSSAVQTNLTAASTAVQLGGDLSGTATSPTVTKLNDGITLPGSAPSASGQVLTTTSSGASAATAWTTPAGGVTLDTTVGDIQALGTQAAGSTGKAADAGHVHPTTGLVTTSTSAGGDLTGTYPNPTLNNTSNVESIISANTTVAGAEQTAHKDTANGYAGLDGSGLLKTAELPSSVVSGSGGASNPLTTEGGTNIVNVPTFQANTVYPAGFVIQQTSLLYARNSAGTSGASWSADSSNWTLLQSNVPAPTQSNQIIVSNSSDAWTLASVGTIASNSYSSSYTVSTSDLGIEDEYNSSSAGTATIPLGLTSTVGAVLAFRQMGSGVLTVAGASGVTVEGTTASTGQYQTLMARQVATNVWAVTGSGSSSGATDAYVTNAVQTMAGGVPSLMPNFLPTGALSENFPRILSDGTDTSLATGTPYIFPGPYVIAGTSYGHIDLYNSGTTQAGGSHAWMALVNSSGIVLAVTADNTSAQGWPGGGTFQTINIAFASAYVPVSSQQTWVAVCIVASTMPTFRGINTSSAGSIAPITGGPSTETGQTTPPSVSGTIPFPTTSSGVTPYCWLKA